MIKSNYIKFLFLVIVFVLLAVSILTYRNLNNYISEVKLIRHSNSISVTAEKVLSTIKDAEIGHRGYQLTRDTIYLQPYYSSLTSLPAQINELDSLVTGNEEQQKRVDTLEMLINSQFVIISKILSNAQRSSLYMDRYESGLLAEGRINMTEIRAVIKRMIAVEHDNFHKRVTNENDFKNIAPISLFIYALIALGGVTILFSKVLDALRKRKKAEDDLWENVDTLRKEVKTREFIQKTLRSILDNSLDGIMAFKAIRNKRGEIEDFECLLANTVSIVAIKDGELTGKRLLTIIPEDKTNGMFEFYTKAVIDGTPLQMERLRVVNGSQKWFHVTVVKLEDGFVTTFSDITQQKMQRILTEEGKILLDEAESLAKMGSWKWSIGDNEMIWSDGLYVIMGKDASHKPSWNSFLDNVHPDDVGNVEEFIKNIKIHDGDLELDYRIVLNGTVHYVSVTSKARDKNQHTDIIGAVIDVTQRKTYERQLQQYNNDLKRSNEDLEQFAYVASHDLQEPLRKIRAFGDRLALRYKDTLDESGADYIARMQSAAERMQLLIEDLLSFARVSRNVGEFQALDLKQLINEVLDDLDSQIKREHAVIEVATIPSFNGDAIQIKRLFQNLISNAIKFHKPNEKPNVSISGKIMRASALEKDYGVTLVGVNFVCMCVSDNGIGFDEKYAEKIFSIFQRLHGRMEYEGTGIGLAICKKIVSNHGGVILARSKENIGSEFVIVIPLK